MTVTTLELQSAARILRDALRDESYRSTPLGLEVARYIRWKRNEWGATPETIRDDEHGLVLRGFEYLVPAAGGERDGVAGLPGGRVEVHGAEALPVGCPELVAHAPRVAA